MNEGTDPVRKRYGVCNPLPPDIDVVDGEKVREDVEQGEGSR